MQTIRDRLNKNGRSDLWQESFKCLARWIDAIALLTLHYCPICRCDQI